MSSLFKGIAEHAGNHRSVYAPQRSTINNLFLAQVLDVVTGEQVQDYIASGQATKDGSNMTELYKFVGAVRIKIQEYDSNRYENETYRFAFPIDRGNYRLPIPGELVLVMKASIMVEGAGYKDYFYTDVVGGANKSTRHAVRPNAVTPTSEIERSDSPSDGGLLGGLGRVLGTTAGLDAEAAAKRFETKYQHEPATILNTSFGIPAMREGDHIIEGRFGGTIRFTGTLTQKDAWPDTAYVKHMLKGSKDGDPMLLVKIPSLPLADNDSPLVRESAASTPEKADDNINDDLSSIYLNTSQNIPIQLKTSQKLFTWAYDIESEPDAVFGKVDLTTTIVQATIPAAYNPNDIISITAPGSVNLANLGGTNPGTSATTSGEVVTTGEYQAVLIAGLDEAGYKPLEEQVALLQTSFSGRIKGFRYNTPNGEILAFLKQVPKIHVFMFSAGCRKADVVSKSPDVLLDKIYIIEPYAANGNSAVVNAVKDGVPARHVFVGSSRETGKDVVPGAVSSNAPSHWGALAKGGQFIGT